MSYIDPKYQKQLDEESSKRLKKLFGDKLNNATTHDSIDAVMRMHDKIAALEQMREDFFVLLELHDQGYEELPERMERKSQKYRAELAAWKEKKG